MRSYKILQVHTECKDFQVMQKIEKAKKWQEQGINFIILIQSHGFFHVKREIQTQVCQRIINELKLNGLFQLRNNNLFFIPNSLKGIAETYD